MAVKFNPFTGQLQIDEKGAGASYIDGEVSTYADLPLDGTAPLNSAWLVREASGTWLLGRKPAGIYIRTATAGVSRDADYTYAGILPDVFSDANFTLYDDGDSTKNAKFQLSGIATGTIRTITVPNKNVTLDDAGDSRTPTAHAASHAAGVRASYNDQVAGMTANVFIRADNVGTAGNSITLTFDGTDDIDTVLAAWNAANTSNTAELVSGDGSQVPDSAEEITLSGGVAAGSDPFKNINQNLGTSDKPTFDGLVVARNKPSATLANPVHVANFVAEDNTNQAPLVAIGGTGNIEVYKDSAISKALAYGFAQPGLTATDDFIVSLYDPNNGGWRQRLRCAQSGTTSIFGNLVVRDNTGNETATFDAQGNLTANRTYDLPDASGTLALTSDIPANTIASTIVDAKGDLIVGTAADTVARLPVGATNGHVLTVDSAEASGMKWAAASGGVTSVSGTAPIVSSGGTTPTISVTTGTTAGTVAAGDDSRITGAAQKSANLSDLASASTARTNLGVAIGTDVAAASHTHTASAISDSTTAGRALLTAADAAAQRTSLGLAAIAASGSASDLGSGTVPIARLGASGTPSGSTYLAGDNSWKAVTGGVGGSTGATDNVILRSDGTGGANLQDSAFIIADNATASPNNTVNHASIQATGATTNVSVSLVPKGSGSFSLHVPTGNATGGNARGANATDLQTNRANAGEVASGANSFVCGAFNTVSSNSGFAANSSNVVSTGSNNAAFGNGVTVTGTMAFAAGRGHDVSGARAIAMGDGHVCAGEATFACGQYTSADRFGLFAHACGQFDATSVNRGSAQRIRAVLRRTTSNNTATELFLDGSATRLTIPNNKIMAGIINIVGTKTDGAAVAHYVRQFCVKNVSGTSSEVYTPITIGTDNAAGTSITFNNPDTNGDALSVSVTGIASENWRWVASVDAVEILRTTA